MDSVAKAYLEMLVEEANYSHDVTDLPHVIKVSTNLGRDGKLNVHGPRIKVSNIPGKASKDDNFSVSISDEPEVMAGEVNIHSKHLQHVKEWIRLNKDHLLNIWENGGDMLDTEWRNGFKKVSE